MPDLLGEDVEFRERLVEHLVAYSEMFNGIEARSIVSSSILLYGTGVQHPIINNIIRREALPNWLRSFRLNIRVGNVDVLIPFNREIITQTRAELY